MCVNKLEIVLMLFLMRINLFCSKLAKIEKLIRKLYTLSVTIFSGSTV